MEKKVVNRKGALVPLLNLTSNNLIDWTPILQKLNALNEEQFDSFWSEKIQPILERIAGVFEKITETETENDYLDLIESEKDFFEKMNLIDIDVFKSRVSENQINVRNNSYRNLYWEIAISHWIFENRSILYNNIKTKSCEWSAKANITKDNSKSYGYILVDEDLNQYFEEEMKNEGEESQSESFFIDDEKPFIYFNWQWAYSMYKKRGVQSILDGNAVIKIDLKNAFNSIEVSNFEALPNEIKFMLFINGWKNKNLKEKEDIKGIRYGWLIESYYLANWFLLEFKYDLVIKIKKFFGDDFLKIFTYVDDNLLVFKNYDKNNILLDKWREFSKENSEHFSKKGFTLNSEKTNFYFNDDISKFYMDSSASGAYDSYENTVFDDKALKSLAKNERGHSRYKIQEVFNSLVENVDEININSLVNVFFDESGNEDIFENRYAHIYFKRIIDSPNLYPFLDVILKEIYSRINRADARNKNGNLAFKNYFASLLIKVSNHENDKFKIIDKWVRWLTADLVDCVYEKNISTPLTDGHVDALQKISNTSGPVEAISFIERLIEHLAENNIYRSSQINEEKINEAAINKKIIFKIESAEKLIWGKPSIGDEIEDDDFFFSAAKYKIISIIHSYTKDTNNLTIFRLERAIFYSKNRMQMIKNLSWVIRNVNKVQTIDDEKFVSVYDTITDEDKRNFLKFKKALQDEDNLSMFRKWDILVLLRNYVDKSWKNGSRELEHFSNHGVYHSDRLLDAFIKISGHLKLNNTEKFISILSIYIHDIGLVDDQLISNKPDFLKALIQLTNSSGDTQKLIEQYYNIRNSAAMGAREKHGDTSLKVGEKIWNFLREKIDKRTLKEDVVARALLAAALHNGSDSMNQYSLIESKKKEKK